MTVGQEIKKEIKSIEKTVEKKLDQVEDKIVQKVEDGNIIESSRPAAYARVAARLPRYVVRAMEMARPLAYASEVGESFRKVFPMFVKPLYALSIGYVVGDIGIKYIANRHKNFEYKKWFMMDLSLWHLGASLIFPALVINRWVHGLAWGLNKMNFSIKTIKYIPALSAIILIPFIVHPLDHFTDYALDNTFRKYIDYRKYDDAPIFAAEGQHIHEGKL
jgi:fission process protein 1